MSATPARITPAAAPAGTSVTLGWLQGKEEKRRLRRFSPHLTALAAETAGGLLEPIATDELSYIGFPRADQASFVRPPSSELQRLKIYVAGGQRFEVESALPDAASSVDGFYAYPTDPASPFACIFFYSHGINALENAQLPLGEMLVSEGAIKPEDLARGIAAQQPKLGQILVEQATVSPEAIADAIEQQRLRRMRLGELLIEAGLITPANLDAALAEQKKRRGKKVGEILIEAGVIDEKILASTLARKFRIPFIDLDSMQIAPQAAQQVPIELVRRYGFLPIAVDGDALTIAISDPLNTEIADVLRFQLSDRRVREVMATVSQLKRYVSTYLETADSNAGSKRVNEILIQLAVDANQSDARPAEATEILESDSTVVKLATQILIDAYQRGASDIHIEPRGPEHKLIVRFRIDGECEVYQEVPSAFRQPLVARLKIMANLDISERRKPQDGKIRIKLGDRQVELRVATIPTVNQNEDVVMRILAASKPLPLAEMGLSERNLTELRRVIARPYGLVLCVGPTGSGKTTTLHSMLGSLNKPDTKIWTAEDPVEITQDGLRQVQVQPKIGFDFAAAMRAFLRADPDIIMIGEMRDRETASIAVEASLTGHLVLSTLHTNSASETITRLLDMGLDPFNFADAMLGVLAQRLARRLCKSCKQSYEPTTAELDELATMFGGVEQLQEQAGTTSEELRLWRAPGCDECARTGYRGRIALHELLVTSDDIKQATQRRATVSEIRRMAQAGGMTTLMQDGIAKALAGHTDLRQISAVCIR